MANIKKLQMADAICADKRIQISKGFLSTKVTYVATGSPVAVKTIEYTAETGERLKALLAAPRPQLAQRVKDFHPQPTVNGNYMLELCLSADHEFAALMLLHFQHMNYEPVTEVLVFEGEEAGLIAQLF